jgi:hypothetical protein
MSEATLYTPENGAIDWRALADEVFPADALRTAQDPRVDSARHAPWF